MSNTDDVIDNNTSIICMCYFYSTVPSRALSSWRGSLGHGRGHLPSQENPSRPHRELCCPLPSRTNLHLTVAKRRGQGLWCKGHTSVLNEMLFDTWWSYTFFFFSFCCGYHHACSGSRKWAESRYNLIPWSQAPTTLPFRNRYTFSTGFKMSYCCIILIFFFFCNFISFLKNLFFFYLESFHMKKLLF